MLNLLLTQASAGRLVARATATADRPKISSLFIGCLTRVVVRCTTHLEIVLARTPVNIAHAPIRRQLQPRIFSKNRRRESFSRASARRGPARTRTLSAFSMPADFQ